MIKVPKNCHRCSSFSSATLKRGSTYQIILNIQFLHLQIFHETEHIVYEQKYKSKTNTKALHGSADGHDFLKVELHCSLILTKNERFGKLWKLRLILHVEALIWLILLVYCNWMIFYNIYFVNFYSLTLPL